MSNADTLKEEIRKLSARAMQLKMDLHDLSEALPTNWQAIPDVARAAFAAFSELEAKRAQLANLKRTNSV